MPQTVAIVDYGICNLFSVHKKITSLNARAVITADAREIQKADKIILPGVGHFGTAMRNFKKLGLTNFLNEEVLVKKKQVLGICLGMQMMALGSEEDNREPGLGWINAEVVRFSINDKTRYKVPHIGWNDIRLAKSSLLMRNIPDQSEFYFIHSYHYRVNDLDNILNETGYESPFVSAVEKENIYGVQYHPEKSHDIGEILFRNFLNI